MRTLVLSILFATLVLLSGCTGGGFQAADQPDNSADLEQDANADDGGSEYYVLDGTLESGPVGCQPDPIDWITDLNIYQTPGMPEPLPRTPFRDPVFGTCLVRVTDRRADILNPDDPSKGMKNEYARVQSFNADDSLLLVRSIESFWYVSDAKSLLPLGEVPVVVEPRWDSKNPAWLYFTDETRLMRYDLSTGKLNMIRDFAEDFPQTDLAAVWTRYEGSPSYDSRFWGLMAQNSDWETVAFLIYDLQEDTLVVREIPRRYSIDNVTISPLGTYFLASFDNYCEYDQPGSDGKPCGLMVYDSKLENGRSLLRIVGHYDALLDAAGCEVILYQDIDTDDISMLDLATGTVTPLLPIDFSHSGIGFHFSGRASDLPGWGLISTYNGGNPMDATWMDDSVFAVELKVGGRVVRLAHTHSLYNEEIEQDYWAEPHASMNRDFTRIVFTSNWGRTGTEEVDLYMVELPEDWTELLPSE